MVSRHTAINFVHRRGTDIPNLTSLSPILTFSAHTLTSQAMARQVPIDYG